MSKSNLEPCSTPWIEKEMAILTCGLPVDYEVTGEAGVTTVHLAEHHQDHDELRMTTVRESLPREVAHSMLESLCRCRKPKS